MSRTAFDWADPFDLDSQLSEEERMVEKTAHDYAPKRLAPRVLEMFRHERADPTIFREMGELGFLGPTISADFGGSGLGYVSYGLIARQIERVDSGYRSMMSVQSSLVMVPIEAFGSLAQKQKYLPKLASGEWIGCFGLTEPDHGSDPGSMVTRAKKVRGRLLAHRRQGVDLQLADIRCVSCLGEDRGRRHSRLHPGEGRERPQRPRDPRQGRPARLDHRRDRARRRICSRGEHAARGWRPEGSVHVPEFGALRHRLGRARRSGGVLRHRARNTCSTASSSAARSPPTS